MPLGMELGLCPGHIVWDGAPAPSERGTAPPPIFVPCLLWPNGWMDQDATWYRGRPRPRPHSVTWGRISSHHTERSTAAPHSLSDVYCGQTAWWIGIPLGTEVGLDAGESVLVGDAAPFPIERGTATPSPALFGLLCSGTVAHLSNCCALDIFYICASLNCWR